MYKFYCLLFYYLYIKFHDLMTSRILGGYCNKSVLFLLTYFATVSIGFSL